MVDNIIKSVAEKLSSLSYIEGIVLGGSRARGTHTEDSDIDIGIYYNSESFDINTINNSLQSWMMSIEITLLYLPEHGVIGLMAADG